MSALVIRSLTKSYANGVNVLDSFDLVVQPGELVVLVGPSGCGKSTLLKLIAGLERPDAGQLLLEERDITGLEPRHRGIAMVFQNYALYPHLTVRDNLAYPLRRQRISEREIARRVASTAAQLRLDALLDRRPAQLSGGQKQRVAMGRAIIREPALFLLDEPLSNLDSELRAHVRGEIRDLQRRLGATMIYVTHDQVEAQTLADRLVILRDGRIQQAGPPRAIYARPANMFAAAFLGATPPNFLSAQTRDGGLEIAGRHIPFAALPAELRTALAGREHVFVGLRPEALRPVGEAASRDLRIGGRVMRREHVGDTQYVYFCAETDIGCADTIAALSGRRTAEALVWATRSESADDIVELAIEPEQMLFFDAEGASIGSSGGEAL